VEFCYLLSEESEIRLFILYPSLDVYVVSGSMEYSPRHYKASKQYEVLSYFWGDIGDSDTIFVNGCTISVAKSPEAALRYLRYQD